MNEEKLDSFMELICKNLESNGFPHKKVSLPLEKLYESADSKGINLNDVLKKLEDKAICHEKSLDKIIFSSSNGKQENLFKQAQDMMSKMTPEQLQELQNLYQNMSDEEKEEIMRKGSEMGII